jgi:predicted regulator of Ras-like GTPase activity (Roadblock/LC7/MglB family)
LTDAPGSRYGTEFGAVLAELIARVPGAYSAVLSDRDGYAIDFAFDATATEEIEVQIAGAQCGLVLLATAASATRHGLGRCDVMLETAVGSMLGAVIDEREGLVLVILLRARGHLGLALRNLESARTRLAGLLS